MDQRVLQIQQALNAKGFTGLSGRPLTEDGIDGRNTRFAVVNFKRSIGYRARPYVGPLTFKALTQGMVTTVAKAEPKYSDVPWLAEMYAMLGKHESRNHTELWNWLKSDGSSVGDPDRIPWCGDAVETALRRWNPGYVVPNNPYLAANWNKDQYGESCEAFVGAIVVFWRGSPSSWKGHIGFIVGGNRSNWYVLGGNQGDSVTITPISKGRVRQGGIRCPIGWTGPRTPPPYMTGGTVSTNEA